MKTKDELEVGEGTIELNVQWIWSIEQQKQYIAVEYETQIESNSNDIEMLSNQLNILHAPIAGLEEAAKESELISARTVNLLKTESSLPDFPKPTKTLS